MRGDTYGRNGLHAEHKGILGKVARVGERVLLPQLTKQILHAAHIAEVVGKVPFKEQMDASTCTCQSRRLSIGALRIHRTNHLATVNTSLHTRYATLVYSQDGDEIRRGNTGPHPLHHDVRDTEDGSAPCRKHGAELQRIPLIGEVAHDLGLDGIVRM
jgi:hypothetical protein